MFQIPAIDFAKYNKPMCYEVSLTSEVLDAYRANSHAIHGLPGFMDDFIHLNLESPDLGIILKHPELVQWLSDGTAVLLPDYPYIKSESGDLLRKSKNEPEGLSLGIWYIHPKQLEETVFSSPENRNDFRKATKSFCYDPSLKPVSRLQRNANQKRIKDIEESSGIPYLASALDLNAGHIQWLKELKIMALGHLSQYYNVTDEDNTLMFFHRIIAPPHVTLHLHIRVNQGMHPLEKSYRLMLDDIIEGLEYGKTVKNLILDAGPHYSTADTIGEISRWGTNVSVKNIANPFFVDRASSSPENRYKNLTTDHQKT